MQAQKEVITVEEAIAILNQAIFPKGGNLGGVSEVRFRNPKVVNAIINKYGYKKIKEYELIRNTIYSPLWYKNTTYPGTSDYGGKSIRPLSKGIPSVVALSSVDGYIEIKVFSNSLYENLLNQLRAMNFMFVEFNYLGNGATYTNGQYDADVNNDNKNIRITKQY